MRRTNENIYLTNPIYEKYVFNKDVNPLDNKNRMSISPKRYGINYLEYSKRVQRKYNKNKSKKDEDIAKMKRFKEKETIEQKLKKKRKPVEKFSKHKTITGRTVKKKIT
jgi:hypothetical protein